MMKGLVAISVLVDVDSWSHVSLLPPPRSRRSWAHL